MLLGVPTLDSHPRNLRPAHGARKTGAEVTFKESVEGGIRYVECADANGRR